MANNAGRPLKYSEIAPLMRDFRQKLFNVLHGCKVKIVDLTQKAYIGTLTAWNEKNDRWSFEVAVDPVATKGDPSGAAGATGTFRFVASRCPGVEVSAKCAVWLGQDDGFLPGRTESDGSMFNTWTGDPNEAQDDPSTQQADGEKSTEALRAQVQAALLVASASGTLGKMLAKEAKDAASMQHADEEPPELPSVVLDA